MALLRCAAKFDPSFSLDCAPRLPPWRNPRKIRDQILPSGNLGGHDGGVDGDGDHGVEARDGVVYPAAVLSGHEATLMVHRFIQVKSGHFEAICL